MSNNNGSIYGNLSRFFASNVPLSSNSSNDNETNQDIEANFFKHSQDSSVNSYSPSIKRPRMSIKQLNLTSNCDNDTVHSDYLYSSSIRRLTDSAQRPSSRLSLSTASSTSTTPANYKNSKFLFSSGRLSSDVDHKSELSSISGTPKQSKSYFYPGRTSFGGSNLRKNIRRLGTTPYSLSKIQCIEAKRTSTQNQSNSLSTFKQNLNLSSVTQRILEKLENAATPIHDAKRKQFPTDSVNRFPLPKKLYDTSVPNVFNHGHCNVDLNHQPRKYVLSQAKEDSIESDLSKKDEITKDIERLKDIQRAEVELRPTEFVPKKDVTHGKVTSRDLKKSRKFLETCDDDTDHYKSLANVRPLGLPSTNLKPFTFGSVANTNQPDAKTSKSSEFNFSSPTSVASNKPSLSVSLDVNFSSPKDLSKSRFDSKAPTDSWDEKYKSQGKNWCENEDIEDVEDTDSTNTNSAVDGSCISKSDTSKFSFNSNLQSNVTVEHGSTEPTFKVDNQSNSSVHCSSEFGASSYKIDSQLSKPKSSIDKFDYFLKPNLNSSSLNLFKKDVGKTWACPTCFVSNDPDEIKCVSCEESNPDKKSQVPETKSSSEEFKFGTFSSSSNSLSFLKKDVGKTWKCPTCLVSNDIDEAKCVSCEEANPNKKSQTPATKSSSEEFKFGSFSTSSNSLSFLKKDVGKTWTCPTCCVSNDPEENKCVSCEEPNPNKKRESSNSETKSAAFKFGSFKDASSTSSKVVTSSANVMKVDDMKKSAVDSWICYYCKSNNSNSDLCCECKKIKVTAATKEEVHKFVDSQTFKFGFNKPTQIAIKSPVDASQTTFKFGVPSLTPVGSKRKSIPTEESVDNSKNEPPSLPSKISFEKEPSSKTDSIDSTEKSEAPIASKSLDFLEDTNKQSVKFDNASTNQLQFPNTKSSSTSGFMFGSKIEAPASTSSGTSTNPYGELIHLFYQNKFILLLYLTGSLFAFGSTTKSEPNTTSTITSIFSVKPSTEIAPNTSNKDSTLPKNIFETVSTTSSTTPASNMFVFGSNLTNVSSDVKPGMFNLGAPESNTKASSQSTSSNIFAFGAAKTESISNATTSVSTNSIPTNFAFGSTTTGMLCYMLTIRQFILLYFIASTTGSTSLFTFGATQAPTNTSTIGKSFNFGPPVEFSKIDVGSSAPISSNINLNFPQNTNVTSTTSNSNSIFSFGSQPSTKSAFEPTINKPEFSFSDNSKPSLFGFNFSGNTNVSSNSMFTFGNKPVEPQQPSFMAPSSNLNSTGFNFAAQAPSQPSFGANPFNPPTLPNTQPQMISNSFGSNAFNASTPQVNAGFKFNADSNLNFPSTVPKVGETNQITIPSQDPTGVFQFSYVDFV